MKLVKNYQSNSIDDSRAIARELAGIFNPDTVVLLQGDLGSGKTFLVKEICKIWQTEDEPSSPSFAIIHQYRGAVPVNHIDFYRINDPAELDNLGWEELLSDGAVTFVEWPRLIEKQLTSFYKVEIEFTGSGRNITLWKQE